MVESAVPAHPLEPMSLREPNESVWGTMPRDEDASLYAPALNVSALGGKFAFLIITLSLPSTFPKLASEALRKNTAQQPEKCYPSFI